MSISEDQVRQVAHLARLGVNDAEVQEHSESLTKILDIIEQMSAIDTKAVTPMSHPIEFYHVDHHQEKVTLPQREDVSTETNERESYQAIAPLAKHGLYLVPQVIE